MIQLAQKALAGLPPADENELDPNFQCLRSGLTNNLAMSYMALGKEDEARLAYVEAQRIGQACGDFLNMYSAIYQQGFLLRKHGHLTETAELFRKTVESANGLDGESEKSFPYIGIIYAGLGHVLLEMNDLAAAETAFLRSMELSRWVAAAEGQLSSVIGLARLKQIQGKVDEGLKILDQVKINSPRVWTILPAMRARLYLAQVFEQPNSLKKALQWAEGKTFTDPDPSQTSIDHFTLARVIIAARWDAAQSPDSPLPEMGPLMDFLADEYENAASVTRSSG